MPPKARRLKPVTRFESIAFCLAPSARVATSTARRVVGKVLDLNMWRVSTLSAGKGEFDAVPLLPSRTVSERSVALAWERVYELRADPRVLWAEPLFEIFVVDHPTTVGDDKGTDDNYEWSLDAMCVKEAWELFGNGKGAPGAGIRVGHPDTGYTEHPEIIGPRLLAKDGYNFEENNKDAHDTLAGGLPGRTPGHGTETSSVIMSGQGKDKGTPGEAFVSGTAPAASLIPIRTTKSSTIWNPRHLTLAIRYATTSQRCNVISISLGGPFSPRCLHSAVKDAESAGVIVLCGAGNTHWSLGPLSGGGAVAYPAAFDEVIAVAASMFGNKEWSTSSRGPAVDITAPGASVWCARTTKRDDVMSFDVCRDSGTSFATAGVAGIAALWLSYHRKTLINKYGVPGIPAAFKEVLQSSCTVPKGWRTDKFGPGIANARELLETPLPEAVTSSLRGNGRKPASMDDDVAEKLVHMSYPAPRSGVVLILADVLRVPEPMLKAALFRIGDEIVFRVARDRRLQRTLRAAAEAAIRPSAARSAGRTRARWVTAIRRQLSGRSASRQLREVLARPQ
jgi:serine protease